MACSDISQKPPLEDETREAPYDDGTQGLKSKSTMEDIKDNKLFSNKWTKSEIIVWCTVNIIVMCQNAEYCKLQYILDILGPK